MSLSNALSNAMSGLAYAARGTEVVAANIANAQTPGYARREIQLSPRPHIATGGGVQIDSVARVVQQSVLAQHRISAASASGAAVLTSFARDIEQAIGTPGAPGSLTATLADFEAALLGAAARPENEAKLAAVLSTAGALTTQLNQLGDRLQDSRTAADKAIGHDVARLSSGLEQVADLNRRIAVHVAQGDDATALMDHRQALISGLSEIVPLQELPRENGRIALVTKGGALLLDGTKPLPIGFKPTAHIVAGMSAGNPLSRLIVDGAELSAGQMTMFAGGRLAANFTVRDQSAPDLQSDLDRFALDLAQRAADPAVDPSLTAQPGLFYRSGRGAGCGASRFCQPDQVEHAGRPERGWGAVAPARRHGCSGARPGRQRRHAGSAVRRPRPVAPPDRRSAGHRAAFRAEPRRRPVLARGAAAAWRRG